MSELPSHRAHHTGAGVSVMRQRCAISRALGAERLRRQQASTRGNHAGSPPSSANGHRKVCPAGADQRQHAGWEDVRAQPGCEGITLDEWQALDGEPDRVEKFDILRRMASPLCIKRTLKSKLSLDAARSLEGCDAWKYKQRLACNRMRIRWTEFTLRVQLWRGTFKTIEGHYGSGVVSYFVFLKWLFLLNLYIFLLVSIFVVVPQIIFANGGVDKSIIGDTSDIRVNQSLQCSLDYQVNVNHSNIGNLVLDFLQGTGWMEKTLVFYGFYVDGRLAIGTFDGKPYFYNMPLAYLLITIIILGLSLILMVKHTARGFRTRLLESGDRFYQYCNVVFGGWDYGLNDPKSAQLKHRSLCTELTTNICEERDAERRKNMRGFRKCRLYTARGIINVFVFMILGGSGYLIYYATQASLNFKETAGYVDQNKFVKLLMEYVPSLAITVLNVIVPLIFKKVVQGEDYSAEMEIQWTLGRTVFLRLASLGVLLGTLYVQVTCKLSQDDPTDTCEVGTTGCPVLRCWETYVGQQIYKLVILDFFTQLGLIFFMDFPRRLIVTKCNCKLSRLIGKPEFEIPKNVLDLVYAETLCWLGAFFSPLIPAICVFKSLILFYLKKLTCIYNYVPPARPYRASKSHSFFMIVLLTAFIMCCIPVGYVIWKIPPSMGCGPFRIYDVMWDIIPITVARWPAVIQQIVQFFVSAGFLLPLFILLSLLVYYFKAISNAHKEMVLLLKQQLVMEGKDKQFLLTRLNEVSGQAGPPGRDRGKRARDAHQHQAPPGENHRGKTQFDDQP